jgi:hypothetical protein
MTGCTISNKAKSSYNKLKITDKCSLSEGGCKILKNLQLEEILWSAVQLKYMGTNKKLPVGT